MSTENQYFQAFNNGYTLAQHEPMLLHTISKNLSSSSIYIDGLFAGKEQFEVEKDKEMSDDLSQLRNTANKRNNDLGREG